MNNKNHLIHKGDALFLDIVSTYLSIEETSNIIVFETTLQTFMWHHHGIRQIWKPYSNDKGHLLFYIIVNPGRRGHLAGILPQILPRSAGRLAGL